jgi:probable FeS assembly SUF system protein SufT
MRYTPTTFTRDCDVVQVPYGAVVTIPAGTPALITQALGDSYTVEVLALGGLYRVAGADADAIGQTAPAAAPPAGAAPADGVDEAQVWEQLRTVYDPEIPVNIVELGLVYDLRIAAVPSGGSRVEVQMTLTAPGCGMGQIIASDAQQRIAALPGVVEADVRVVFDPPWNPEMMSEAAKLELGML